MERAWAKAIYIDWVLEKRETSQTNFDDLSISQLGFCMYLSLVRLHSQEVPRTVHGHVLVCCHSDLDDAKKSILKASLGKKSGPKAEKSLGFLKHVVTISSASLLAVNSYTPVPSCNSSFS